METNVTEEPAKKNIYGSPIALGIMVIIAVAVFRAPEIIGALKPEPAQPAPSPINPQPAPIVNLDRRVKEAIGADPELARRYAALYSVAMGVVGDSERPPRQVQEEIGRARTLLGLGSTEAFDDVKRELLEPYSGTNPDRAQWSAAVSRLSDACLKAAN